MVSGLLLVRTFSSSTYALHCVKWRTLMTRHDFPSFHSSIPYRPVISAFRILPWSPTRRAICGTREAVGHWNRRSRRWISRSQMPLTFCLDSTTNWESTKTWYLVFPRLLRYSARRRLPAVPLAALSSPPCRIGSRARPISAFHLMVTQSLNVYDTVAV